MMAAATFPTERLDHLTDDELDELLIALPAGIRVDAFVRLAPGRTDLGIALSMLQHASSCSHCQERLQVFNASVTAFNQASGRWSDARSNTLNRDLGVALAGTSNSWPRRAEWMAPVTAALLVAVAMLSTPGGLTTWLPVHEYAKVPVAQPTQQAPSSEPKRNGAIQPVHSTVRAAGRAFLVETAAVTTPVVRKGESGQDDTHHAHDNRQLASDNAILLAIDSAIDPREPAPEDFYRTVGGGFGPLNKMAAVQVDD